MEEGGGKDRDDEKRNRHAQAERGRTAGQLLESRSHAPPEHQAREAGQARREPGDAGAPRAEGGRVGQVLAGQNGHRREERHDVDLALLDENREKQDPEDQPARRRRGPPALPERGRHEEDPGEGSPGEEGEVEERTARGAGEVVRRRPHELVQQVEPAPELEAKPLRHGHVPGKDGGEEDERRDSRAAAWPYRPEAVHQQGGGGRAHREHQADQSLEAEGQRESEARQRAGLEVGDVLSPRRGFQGDHRQRHREGQKSVRGELSGEADELEREGQAERREEGRADSGAAADPEADGGDRRQGRQDARQARGQDRDAEQAVARRHDPEGERRLVEKRPVQIAGDQEVSGLEHRDRGEDVHALVAALNRRGVESHEVQPRAEQQDEEAKQRPEVVAGWAHDGVTRNKGSRNSGAQAADGRPSNSSWLWGVESNHQPSG